MQTQQDFTSFCSLLHDLAILKGATLIAIMQQQQQQQQQATALLACMKTKACSLRDKQVPLTTA
jgi:hypothetical protein